MCTPSDPRNQKAPGSGATGGFDGGDDGNRTHDPLLAKQTTAIRKSLVNGYLAGTIRDSRLPVLPILTPVPHYYWHANGTDTSPNPHGQGLVERPTAGRGRTPPPIVTTRSTARTVA
jgi:hypothetical protein